MSKVSPPEHGDDEFTNLYQREYGDVLRFIQRRAMPDQAEDAAADTFLAAWRRFGELPRSPEAARAWLFGVARHVLLNQRRGSQRQEALGVRLAEHAATGSAVVDRDDEHLTLMVDLQRVWPRLTAVHQEALSLAIFEDLDAPTAARVLDISPVAYRLRLSRARRTLRLALQTHPEVTKDLVANPERTAQ